MCFSLRLNFRLRSAVLRQSAAVPACAQKRATIAGIQGQTKNHGGSVPSASERDCEGGAAESIMPQVEA